MVGAANDNSDPAVSPKSGRPCPICGKPSKAASRPFCSKRCADVDLNRWLGGNYRVPVELGEVEPETPDDN